jgi:hypothetical protein
MKPKIGAYLRVSQQSQDVKSQRHAMREWAKLNHVPASEVRWYEDRKTVPRRRIGTLSLPWVANGSGWESAPPKTAEPALVIAPAGLRGDNL